MAKKKMLFTIGRLYTLSPFTKEKETMLVTKFPDLTINLINRYTEGFMYRKDGKAHFYVRDYNKLNHYLSIMMGLLMFSSKTFENEAELHKSVVKYYKLRSKYISVYKENTTKEEISRQMSYRLKEKPDLLRSELLHRGFVTNTSSDKRYLDENWYITCNGFSYPISQPTKSKLKKLLYSKIKIKGLTKLRSHGY